MVSHPGSHASISTSKTQRRILWKSKSFKKTAFRLLEPPKSRLQLRRRHAGELQILQSRAFGLPFARRLLPCEGLLIIGHHDPTPRIKSLRYRRRHSNRAVGHLDQLVAIERQCLHPLAFHLGGEHQCLDLVLVNLSLALDDGPLSRRPRRSARGGYPFFRSGRTTAATSQRPRHRGACCGFCRAVLGLPDTRCRRT